MEGIIDACFIIDWADYSKRDIFELIVDKVYITERGCRCICINGINRLPFCYTSRE